MVLCALVALCGGAQAGPVVSLKGGQLEGVGTAGMGSFFLGVHSAGGMLPGTDSVKFNGTYMAVAQQVVVVSVNYRMGVFGFLGSRQLSARTHGGGSGNFGIQASVPVENVLMCKLRAFPSWTGSAQGVSVGAGEHRRVRR